MSNVSGDSASSAPAVAGANTDSGPGVAGASENGEGVHGETNSAVFAAVSGVNKNPKATGAGVYGENKAGGGVGVWGVSENGEGVHGETNSTSVAAVAGINKNPKATGAGVYGENKAGGGVGVWGVSQNGEGVHGETSSTTQAAVAGVNKNPNATGAGVYGEAKGTKGAGIFGRGQVAGFFEGEVHVTRDLTVDGDVILANADIAEDFDVAYADAEPGMVLCIGDDEQLRPCTTENDTRVVGVISGAGTFRPAVILDRAKPDPTRHPVALTGRVYCKVDARREAVATGDLLTTSSTPGHAMRADPHRAAGAVIGKALRPLRGGTGLVPVLVALQ
jgi:hypothetical protein